MSEPEGPSPLARVFGALFMVVGVLMMGLCGLCSAAILFSPSGGGGESFTGLAMLPVVAIIGGVPIVIGAGIFFLGLFLWRGPRRPKRPTVDTFN